MDGREFFEAAKSLAKSQAYDMDSKEFHKNVICSLRVAKAELALNLLAECDKTSLRQQIQNGIREYERMIKA